MNRFALAAMAALLAGPALARAPSALVRCDGYGARRSGVEDAVMILVITGTGGLFGGGESDNPGARETGEKAVAACTEALGDPRVTGNPIRQAEVLLARGIAQFELRRYDLARADADAVQAVTVPAGAVAEFARTLNVSALLLKARSAVAEGRQADAEGLALKVAMARPYATFLTEEVLNILTLSPEISAEEAELADRQVRLDPGYLLRRAAAREMAGDWAGAASDIATFLGLLPDDVVLRAQHIVDLSLAGQGEAAAAKLPETQALIDLLAAKASGVDQKARTAALEVERADELVLLARALWANQAGQSEAARAILAGRRRWLAPPAIVAAIAARTEAAGGPANPAGSIGLDTAKLRSDALAAGRRAITDNAARFMFVTWPHWESPAVRTGLGKAIAPGARSMEVTSASDGLSTIVTARRSAYGGTMDEAMLLACARAARDKGHARYAIVAMRHNFAAAREGLSETDPGRFIIFPDDRRWPGQAGRSLDIATLESDLAPLFPLPPAR